MHAVAKQTRWNLCCGYRLDFSQEYLVAVTKAEHFTDKNKRANPFERIAAIEHDGFLLTKSKFVFLWKNNFISINGILFAFAVLQFSSISLTRWHPRDLHFDWHHERHSYGRFLLRNQSYWAKSEGTWLLLGFMLVPLSKSACRCHVDGSTQTTKEFVNFIAKTVLAIDNLETNY